MHIRYGVDIFSQVPTLDAVEEMEAIPLNVESVWQILSDVKIGALVAWTVVIIAIFTTITRCIKNVYSFVSKYKEMKEMNERQSKMLDDHEKNFKEIKDSLTKINKSLDEQKTINLKYTRHVLVDGCCAAIVTGNIQNEQLASLEEIYEEYRTVFNGNAYVGGLMERVRALPIILNKDDEGGTPT